MRISADIATFAAGSFHDAQYFFDVTLKNILGEDAHKMAITQTTVGFMTEESYTERASYQEMEEGSLGHA